MAEKNRSPLDATTEIVNALIDEKSISLLDVKVFDDGSKRIGISHQKVIDVFKEIFDVCHEAVFFTKTDGFSK